jgi:antitoxin component of MazEF toxin-antitoxin module
MTKSRIEVAANGSFYMEIPEEVIDDLQLEEGEVVEWHLDDTGHVELTFN